MSDHYVSPEFSKIVEQMLTAEGDLTDNEKDLKQYIKLVISLAKPYVRTRSEFEDLIMAGCIGLLRARRDYKPERSDNFKGYATMCIIGEMYTHCLGNMTSISIPTHIAKASAYINKIERVLSSVGSFQGREEVDAVLLNYNHELEELLEASTLAKVKYNKDRIESIARNSGLDYAALAKLAKDSLVSLISDVVLLNNIVPCESVEKKASEAELQDKLLESLGKKRYLVLKLHYQGYNNPEIAQILHEHGYSNAAGKAVSRAAVKSLLDNTLKVVRKMGIFKKIPD